MKKKDLALEVIERLKKEYPDSGCSLEYNEAWKLLVSVRLAAQCTDARVNVVVQELYKKFPDVNALADAPVEEIEAIVSAIRGHRAQTDQTVLGKLLYTADKRSRNCFSCKAEPECYWSPAKKNMTIQY